MSRIGKIARRSFLIGSAAIVGGVAFGAWYVGRPAPNPLTPKSGEAAFNRANAVITSWFGDLVMLGSVFAIWYHTLAGIRHLIWDTGRMLEIGKAELLGQIIIIVSVLLTVFTIIVL